MSSKSRNRCSSAVVRNRTFRPTPLSLSQSLVFLLIAVSVTSASASAADRYDQPALVAGDQLKEHPHLRTSSIHPVSGDSRTLSANQLMFTETSASGHRHRFGAASRRLKVAKPVGSEAAAASLSSQQVPELQVGCADGFIRADHHHRANVGQRTARLDRKRRSRRTAEPAAEGERRRRGFYQWSGTTNLDTIMQHHQQQAPPQPHSGALPPTNTFSIWAPSLHQISRPYFIPMWGSAGRTPLYFPPQPLNPGQPLDNPRVSYLPPMPYLPPRRVGGGGGDGMMTTSTTTLKPIWEEDEKDMEEDEKDMEEEEMDVDVKDIEDGGDRLNIDGPVWGIQPASPVPKGMGSGSVGNPLSLVPTRRPKQSRTTTPVPSIIHGTQSSNRNPNDQNSFNNNVPAIGGGFGFSSSNAIGSQGGSPLRPNRPMPVLPSNPANPFINYRTTTTLRPQTTARTTTWRPTARTTTAASPVKRPSRCVWAIVSCCTASSGQVNSNCFEELGCQGPFWDTNPCDNEFAQAAIQNALKFYG